MTTVRSIETQIERLEGFRVKLRPLQGRDVRGDTSKLASYPYRRAARERFSVSEWSKKRFSANYQGYDVDVLLRDGKRSTRTNAALHAP